jgi:hypothetical protein
MDRIRPWLYIGKYRETLDATLLSARGIGAMLQLAEAVEQPGITSLYLPVEDGEPLPPGLLRQGIDFVLESKGRGLTVLIACGAGMSRSAAFTVAALKESEALSLKAALVWVKAQHSETLIHPAIWESLGAYYGEPIE